MRSATGGLAAILISTPMAISNKHGRHQRPVDGEPPLGEQPAIATA